MPSDLIHCRKLFTLTVALFAVSGIAGTALAQLPKSGTLTVDPSQIALDYTQMTRTNLPTPGRPEPRITALAFAPDGRTRAEAYADGRCLLAFAYEGRFQYKPVRPLTLPPGTLVKTLAFSPNGKFLAAGLSGHVLVWQVATGHPVADIANPMMQIGALAFSPDSKVLAGAGYPTDSGTGNAGDDVVLWDASRLPAATQARPLTSLKEYSRLHKMGGSVTQIVWFVDSVGLSCIVQPDDAPGALIRRYVCFQIPPSPSRP